MHSVLPRIHPAAPDSNQTRAFFVEILSHTAALQGYACHFLYVIRSCLTCELAPDQIATGELVTGKLVTGRLAAHELARAELAAGEEATGELATGKLVTGRLAAGLLSKLSTG